MQAPYQFPDELSQQSQDPFMSTAQLDEAQMGLAGLGLIPGPIGIGADLTDMFTSLGRGDYGYAALSGLAAIPGLGMAFAGRGALKSGLRAGGELAPLRRGNFGNAGYEGKFLGDVGIDQPGNTYDNLHSLRSRKLLEQDKLDSALKGIDWEQLKKLPVEEQVRILEEAGVGGMLKRQEGLSLPGTGPSIREQAFGSKGIEDTFGPGQASELFSSDPKKILSEWIDGQDDLRKTRKGQVQVNTSGRVNKHIVNEDALDEVVSDVTYNGMIHSVHPPVRTLDVGESEFIKMQSLIRNYGKSSKKTPGQVRQAEGELDAFLGDAFSGIFPTGSTGSKEITNLLGSQIRASGISKSRFLSEYNPSAVKAEVPVTKGQLMIPISPHIWVTPFEGGLKREVVHSPLNTMGKIEPSDISMADPGGRKGYINPETGGISGIDNPSVDPRDARSLEGQLGGPEGLSLSDDISEAQFSEAINDAAKSADEVSPYDDVAEGVGDTARTPEAEDYLLANKKYAEPFQYQDNLSEKEVDDLIQLIVERHKFIENKDEMIEHLRSVDHKKLREYLGPVSDMPEDIVTKAAVSKMHKRLAETPREFRPMRGTDEVARTELDELPDNVQYEIRKMQEVGDIDADELFRKTGVDVRGDVVRIRGPGGAVEYMEVTSVRPVAQEAGFGGAEYHSRLMPTATLHLKPAGTRAESLRKSAKGVRERLSSDIENFGGLSKMHKYSTAGDRYPIHALRKMRYVDSRGVSTPVMSMYNSSNAELRTVEGQMRILNQWSTEDLVALRINIEKHMSAPRKWQLYDPKGTTSYAVDKSAGKQMVKATSPPALMALLSKRSAIIDEIDKFEEFSKLSKSTKDEIASGLISLPGAKHPSLQLDPNSLPVRAPSQTGEAATGMSPPMRMIDSRVLNNALTGTRMDKGARKKLLSVLLEAQKKAEGISPYDFKTGGFGEFAGSYDKATDVVEGSRRGKDAAVRQGAGPGIPGLEVVPGGKIDPRLDLSESDVEAMLRNMPELSSPQGLPPMLGPGPRGGRKATAISDSRKQFGPKTEWEHKFNDALRALERKGEMNKIPELGNPQGLPSARLSRKAGAPTQRPSIGGRAITDDLGQLIMQNIQAGKATPRSVRKQLENFIAKNPQGDNELYGAIIEYLKSQPKEAKSYDRFAEVIKALKKKK